MIEGGIAGEINVRGRKPFDFSGFELSGSLNGVLSQQSEKIAPNGNLLISDRWKTGIGEIGRSEEHTSELQSLMRISYAVFCLKKKKNTQKDQNQTRYRVNEQ